MLPHIAVTSLPSPPPSLRPYYWDASATGSHYELMASDWLNNMN